MTGEPLDDLSVRLERERRAADEAYHAALTALDRAAQPSAPRLSSPPRVDRARLADLHAQWSLVPSGAGAAHAPDSSIGGRMRSLAQRLLRPVLERQQAFNAAVVDHLNRGAVGLEQWTDDVQRARDAVHDAFGALARFESLLLQYLQTITAYVDTKDRAHIGTDLRDRVSAAERRMAALKLRVAELATASGGASPATSPSGGGDPSPRRAGVFADDVDSLTYVCFEDTFRGSTDEIRARVEDYLPLFSGLSDVVDIGCGRGELLALLKTRGVAARGVDSNRGMVELCRGQGLQVDHGDALSFLRQQDQDSLGGLIAVQVVEHFEPAYLMRFVETAYLKMRPGAPLVLETLNPACWMAFFETYIRDLTHQSPLHPDTLSFVVRSAGFTSVDIRFRAPVRPQDRLDRVAWSPPASAESKGIGQLIAAVNDHADKLNARLFSSMDYAIVARR